MNLTKDQIKAAVEKEFLQYRNEILYTAKINRAAALIAARLSADSGWISVEERLPEFDALPMLTFGRPEWDETEPEDVNKSYFESGVFYDNDGNKLIITHWQPLPKAPAKQPTPEPDHSRGTYTLADGSVVEWEATKVNDYQLYIYASKKCWVILKHERPQVVTSAVTMRSSDEVKNDIEIPPACHAAIVAELNKSLVKKPVESVTNRNQLPAKPANLAESKCVCVGGDGCEVGNG